MLLNPALLFRDRDPLDLRLPRLVVELWVLSLGLDLRGWMPTARPRTDRERVNGRLADRNSLDWMRPAQPRFLTHPSPSPSLGPLMMMLAWPASLPVWIPSLAPLEFMLRAAWMRRASKLTTRRAVATFQHTALIFAPISAPISVPPDADSTGEAGVHADHCRSLTCSAAVHEGCRGFIAAHAATSCLTKCPQICRHFTGTRCAYGARASDRLPGAPPALNDLAERKLLHAYCVPNATS